MTLIDDMLVAARFAAAKSRGGPAKEAAERLLSAAELPGGLAAVFLRQYASALESRLVTLLRATTEELVKDDEP